MAGVRCPAGRGTVWAPRSRARLGAEEAECGQYSY